MLKMKSSIKAWRGVAWPSKPNLATVVKNFFKENQKNKSLLLLDSLTSFSIETLKILEREAQ